MRLLRASVVSALALAALVVALPAAAAGNCCPNVTEPFPNAPPNEIVQEFLFNKKMHTAWKVQYAFGTSRGLYITGAWFRPGPGKPWIKVLSDLRLSEIFVPYHGGQPRFYDLTDYSFNLEPATPEDAGCCGEILDGVVIKEVRSHGIGWKDDQRVHRSTSLVLWATLDASNYNYIMEYEFVEDGTIIFGIGATARNLPGRETIAHMHLGLWRMDIDLDGPAGDQALLTRHVETTSAPDAVDTEEPFNGGVEGYADWDPEQFTTLRFLDPSIVNANGKVTAWDLSPVRNGTARHEESFTHHDFWVTVADTQERWYPDVETYVNGQSVTGADVVAWIATPAHHVPRDEDGIYVGPTFRGSTTLMWSRAMLRPRNLFSRTPFFPY